MLEKRIARLLPLAAIIAALIAVLSLPSARVEAAIPECGDGLGRLCDETKTCSGQFPDGRCYEWTTNYYYWEIRPQ